MDQTDTVLVIIAVRGPVSRISLASVAIVLLAVVQLRQGGVLDF